MANFRDLTVRLYVEANTEKGLLKAQKAFDDIADSAERAQSRIDRANKSSDKTSGIFSKMASAVASAGGSFAKVGTSLTKATALFGVAGAAISTFGAATAAATGPVFGLLGSLAPLTGAIAALPGAFVAAKGAVAIFNVATSRMREIIGAIADDKGLKFVEILDQMAPSAQKVAKELKGAWPIFERIQFHIENGFFAALANLQGPEGYGAIDNLAIAWHRLSFEMRDVAGFMGNIIAELVQFGSSFRVIQGARSILNDLKQSLSEMQIAVRPVAAAFVDISVEGSRFVASLVPGLVQLTLHFSRWVSDIVRSGQAWQWMSNAVVVLKQLAILVKDLVLLFAGLLRAMESAGAGALGVLGKLVQGMQQWVNSAQGQEILIEVFKGLNAVGAAFLPVLKAIVELIGGLAPYIAQLAQMAGPLLANVIKTLGSAFKALMPAVQTAFNSLSVGINNALPGLIYLAGSFGEIVIAVSPLLSVLGRMANILMMSLATAFKNLSGPLMGFVQQIGKLLVVLAQLIGPLIEIGAQLAAVFIDALTQIMPIIRQVVQILGEALIQVLLSLANAITPVIPQIVAAAKAFGEDLVQSLRLLMPMMVAVIEQWIRLLPALLQLIPPLFELGRQLLPVVQHVLEMMLPHAEQFNKILVEIFIALLPLIPEILKLVEALIPLAAQITHLGVQVSNLLLPVVEDMLPRIIPVIEGIVQWFTWLFNVLVGNSIIPDLVREIARWWQWGVDQVNRIVQWFTNLPRMFAEWFGNVVREAVNKINELLNVIRQLPQWILNAIGNIGELLRQSGRNLMQGFINGLWDMYNQVMSTVGDILERIRAAFPFSPAKWGPFSGRGYTLYSGQALIRDFAKGIRSQNGVVDEALSDTLSTNFRPELPALEGNWTASFAGMPALAGMNGGQVVIQNMTLQFADDRDMYTKGKEFAEGLREYRRRGGKLPT